MLGPAAASAIGLYQRYVSPHKGFCCAYRVQTGRRSCSAYGKTIASRLGFLALIEALPRRFARCKASFVALASAARSRPAVATSEAEDEQRKGRKDRDCDPGDACDLYDTATGADCGGCDAVPCDCSF